MRIRVSASGIFLQWITGLRRILGVIQATCCIWQYFGAATSDDVISFCRMIKMEQVPSQCLYSRSGIIRRNRNVADLVVANRLLPKVWTVLLFGLIYLICFISELKQAVSGNSRETSEHLGICSRLGRDNRIETQRMCQHYKFQSQRRASRHRLLILKIYYKLTISPREHTH